MDMSDMEVSEPDMEPEIETKPEIEEVKEEAQPEPEEVQNEPIKEDMEEPQEDVAEETENEESVSETETNEDKPEDMEETEDKSEAEEKPVKKQENKKEKAAKKIVKKMGDKGRYDSTNQLKTLIVMQVLGDTKTFFDSQKQLNDRQGFFTDYMIPDTQIENNNIAQYYLFGGSEGLMNDMIMQQWQTDSE